MCLQKCNRIHPEGCWKTSESEQLYKFELYPTNPDPIILQYREQCFLNSNHKKVPTVIFNADPTVKESFLRGVCLTTNLYKESDATSSGSLCICGRLAAAGVYHLFHSLNNHAIFQTSPIDERPIDREIYLIEWNQLKYAEHNYTCVQRTELVTARNSNYVYDLTTENHHFAAGVGDLIVHNTDSVFINFNPKDENGEPLKGAEARKKSIELGLDVEKSISKHLKKPHKLEYEKVFDPWMLFSKKRYVGLKYEMCPNTCKMNSMGIVLKRRDNAPILKYVYGNVINTILYERDVNKSIAKLTKDLNDLMKGEFPLDYLIISKSLKSHYKTPDQIVHKVLADRMAERDPGSAPQPNDRIPYVYVNMGKTKVTLQGERVETPAYIVENNLKPDYLFYITNQICKPVSQIYELALENLPGYKLRSNHWEEIRKNLRREDKSADFIKRKITDLRLKQVQSLIFQPITRVEENRRNGNQDLTRWFCRK
jgi:hypothetical protein